jgi:hypothetical protein
MNRKKKKIIYSLFLFIPIILSCFLYYYKGFIVFGNNFNFYFFTPNLTFDENTHYFPRVFAIVDNFSFNLNDNINSKNFNFLQFVPIFFTSLIIIVFVKSFARFHKRPTY